MTSTAYHCKRLADIAGTIFGVRVLNVLQHRFTPSPLVIALMGAQAVTHRHADHIIAVPDPVRSQAVAVAE